MNRPRLPQDNIGKPCDCLECQAAGITDRPIVKVAVEGSDELRWIHGEPLKRWYDARANFLARFKQATGRDCPEPEARS